MTKKILSAEFKRECAKLVINHGYKYSDAATAMDVSISSMQRLKFVAKRPKQHHYPSGGKASVIAPNHLNRQFNPEQLVRRYHLYSHETRLVVLSGNYGFMLTQSDQLGILR